MVRIRTLLDILGSAVALLALAPVLPFLDPPVLAIALLALGIGFWCDRRETYPLHGGVATVIAIAAILFYGVQVTRFDVATPVVHALVLLLAIRLATPKQARDYLQIFVLALFILAGSSLLSLEMGFIVYLVLMIFGVTLGLVLLTVFVTDNRLAMPKADLFKLIRVGLIMPAVSLVLMLVFFVTLPRTRHPLWNFLNPGNKSTVGITETVRPGAFSELSEIKALAFRAEVQELAPEQRYWRALVMNQPKGSTWVRVVPPERRGSSVVGGNPIKLTIYPEPRKDRYLITLEQSSMIDGLHFRQAADHVFVSSSALDHRYRIDLTANPDGDLQAWSWIERDFYLTLPDQISERMQEAARQIVAEASDQEGRVAGLSQFFRGQQLAYAQDDLPSGADPIDDFLFEKKRGYCEFFASAYVTLARLAGIPSRLVGGYYGGDYNPLGGYYLVTEDTAHVWVEILTDDDRWVRIDPSQWAINASTALVDRRTNSLNTFRQMIDTLNYHWVQAVVIFDLGRQLSIFQKAREQFRGLRSPKAEVPSWFGAVVLIVVTGVMLRVLVRYRRISPEARLLAEFQARVRKRHGPEAVSPATGLAELGERFDNEHCREFARIYQGAVFRDRPLDTRERARLKELLKEI